LVGSGDFVRRFGCWVSGTLHGGCTEK